MAMNYVGSISILDRGDAPAQAVIDRNARSLAQRVADETKDELHQVMSRVDNIYGTFELTNTIADTGRSANMEYMNDLAELEDILTDQVKKKKYQQQVTVFIVGYEDISSQKMKLLQQVNDFFQENIQSPEEEVQAHTPDIDMEEVSDAVEESLKTAEQLAGRLADINYEIKDYLIGYANAKASNKGKKKLEKALQQAKDDIGALSERLLAAHQEIEEKEDKMQQLFKQVEMKNMEAQRYKTAAEVAKKTAGESDFLKDEIQKRDEAIKDLRQVIESMKLDIGQVAHSKEQSNMRLRNAADQASEQMDKYEKALEDQHMQIEEEKRQLKKMHEQEILSVRDENRMEVEKMRKEHTEEVKRLLASRSVADADRDGSKDRSRPATKEGSRQESRLSVSKPGSKQSSRASLKSKPSSRQSSRSDKEFSEIGVQDEGGNPDNATVDGRVSKPGTRGNTKSKSSLAPVQEADIMEFKDTFALNDDESWAGVPAPHVPGRFLQYRQLTKQKLTELEDQLDVTITKTDRKVKTLKAQFQEHKSKWHAERHVLVNQVEQAHKLQGEAETEANAAMNQLEDFIVEQEELEKEEEEKRQEIESRSVTRQGSSMSVVEAEARLQQTLDQQKQELLQQTDDAKAEVLSRQGSFSESPTKLTDRPPGLSRSASVQGDTHDAIRQSSAQSRASLRTAHRDRLSARRQSIDELRVKSPALSLRSQKSVLSDLELDEDADLPFPDDVKAEEIENKSPRSRFDIGTSPPPKELTKTSLYSRKSIPMSEHPIVQEYLKTYDTVVSFKEALGKLMLDKDMMSAGQMLVDLEVYDFDTEDRVIPQIEEMSRSVRNMLEESAGLLGSILLNDREYPVSSIMGLSRDNTMTTRTNIGTREKTQDRGKSRMSQNSNKTSVSENLKELQQQYLELQERFEVDSKNHQDQLNHNTVVMMEMQDTINALQRELQNLRNQAALIQQDGTQTPVMFTRLDSERNAKNMKKAVNEQRLSPHIYQDAVEQMDSYISLPAKRLAHLVHKYVHHCQMKQIEENVRQSKSLNDNVFMILDKMEALQNVRARRWAEQMDGMGAARMKLAQMLMDTLDNIEQESGIFLIKPMYSYRPSLEHNRFGGKLSRPLQPSRELTSHKALPAYQSRGHVPTPSSQVKAHRMTQSYDESALVQQHKVLEGDSTGLVGKSEALHGDNPRPVWNPTMSTSRPLTQENKFLLNSHLNTPKILEMDINRMLIGQNQVSTMMAGFSKSDDRLVNAANTSVRSYVTVNRPVGQSGSEEEKRPRSHTGITDQSVPPSTPLRSLPNSAGDHRTPVVALNEMNKSIPATPPLPPITPNKGRNNQDSQSSPTSLSVV